MQTHELKINSEFYAAVSTGVKTFEIRKNDRNFQVNDKIVLRPCNDGRFLEHPPIRGHITYITDYMQQAGYVVFSFEREFEDI